MGQNSEKNLENMYTTNKTILVYFLYSCFHLVSARRRRNICYCPCATTTGLSTIDTTITLTQYTSALPSSPSSPSITVTTTSIPSPTVGLWLPTGVQPWYIQYTGTMDFTKNVSVYNIDLFDTSQPEIDALHARNVKVLCYFSAGTYENWRPDVSSFLSTDLGKSNGWAGEKWIDIR